MKRREFLKTSALAAAGSMTLPFACTDANGKKAIGLQLYTLRDVIMSDVKGILSAVAEMGYTEVETYGYKEGSLFGMEAKEFAKFLENLGVKVASGHYGIDLATSSEWERACADAREMGQQYVVVPWMDKKFYETLDALKVTCNSLNMAGEVAKKYKLQMGYHNHAFEFTEVEGKVVYDTMLELLNPKLVTMEMDLFWVVNAGKNPLAYFQKYPGRFELWHVKDMDNLNKENNADVGTGSIDYTALFANAKKSGMKKFFMEQETYPSSPMESAKKSIDYLKTIL